MKDLEERLAITRNKNVRKSHTAKLWLLYMQYISIVKEYILSERTCNWALHLHTIQKMMNLFAMGFSRRICNFDDCNKFYNWFVTKTCTLYQLEMLQFMDRMLLIVMKLKLYDPKFRKAWIKLTSLMHISKRKINLCHLVILQEVSRLTGRIP